MFFRIFARHLVQFVVGRSTQKSAASTGYKFTSTPCPLCFRATFLCARGSAFTTPNFGHSLRETQPVTVSTKFLLKILSTGSTSMSVQGHLHVGGADRASHKSCDLRFFFAICLPAPFVAAPSASARSSSSLQFLGTARHTFWTRKSF